MLLIVLLLIISVNLLDANYYLRDLRGREGGPVSSAAAAKLTVNLPTLATYWHIAYCTVCTYSTVAHQTVTSACVRFIRAHCSLYCSVVIQGSFMQEASLRVALRRLYVRLSIPCPLLIQEQSRNPRPCNVRLLIITLGSDRAFGALCLLHCRSLPLQQSRLRSRALATIRSLSTIAATVTS